MKASCAAALFVLLSNQPANGIVTRVNRTSAGVGTSSGAITKDMCDQGPGTIVTAAGIDFCVLKGDDDGKFNYNDARDACVKLGLHLASPHNSETASAIDLARKDLKPATAWISMNCAKPSGGKPSCKTKCDDNGSCGWSWSDGTNLGGKNKFRAFAIDDSAQIEAAKDFESEDKMCAVLKERNDDGISTWKAERCTQKLHAAICQAMRCTTPTVTGYSILEKDRDIPTFSVVADCKRGFFGTAVVTRCSIHGEPYTVSGCKAIECTKPDDKELEGYKGITEKSTLEVNFDVSAACDEDNGYKGTPVIEPCTENGKPWLITGCKKSEEDKKEEKEGDKTETEGGDDNNGEQEGEGEKQEGEGEKQEGEGEKQEGEKQEGEGGNTGGL